MRFRMLANTAWFQTEPDNAVRPEFVEGPRDPLSGSVPGANGKQRTNIRQNLIWELFSGHPLSCVNFYWRLSHGLRAAHAIELSRRRANGKPGQCFFVQPYTCVRSASRAFGPWK